MKNIYLIRHGESKAQTGEEYSFDASLSEKGILQSKQLGKCLSSFNFDITFLSPLRRARQTLEFANFAKNNVIFDSRLVEGLPPNSYKSSILPYEHIEYGKQDIYNAWENSIAENIKKFICDLRKIQAQNILIISHGGVLSFICKYILSQETNLTDPYINYCRMDNCGISQFFIDETDKTKDQLLYWNRIC